MNQEDLKALMNYIDESSLAYLDYETPTHHVVIAKEVPQLNINQKNDTPPAAAIEAPIENAAEEVENTMEAPAEEKGGQVVEAPMVGVVYLQPHPDDAPYVKVGDRVEQGDVICIVEAMKLMNEIQAPYSGVITEILVGNEEVVEYNQPLMRIEG
jgi:acetyl-CoA carboxylase biotin carboxyl carrier protein